MTTNSRAAARRQAVATAGNFRIRKFVRPQNAHGRTLKPSEYFGCNTFSLDLMSEKLPGNDVEELRKISKSGKGALSLEIADRVAFAAKEWATSRGATHYCHWFQPQTGLTAEKHDSFFSLDDDSRPIEQFTGKQLVQSEPDASSFPSGGSRSTFEARGYTAWDCSSPMFLLETDNGLTLCIPSAFISYHGEALDQKTPLMRSNNCLSDAASEALALLGHSAEFVTTNAGPEQEYFVVDENLYNSRPDLVLAGRALLGKVPPKGQQLDDHYFGSIKPRILNFMMECEHELYRLGVPCKTRHNEVAPSQCEMAPIFENANVASDHNQLVMEVVKVVARRHGLQVTFHEKPYAGMNGSGKHVNWSMSDSEGNNLLNPGTDPHENLRFLYFLSATIKAIHDYGHLMRSAVASAGNDFRLGANEAPPAIMSVFLGDTLTEVVERITNGGGLTDRAGTINLDLAHVPVISRDNTDRNRTSPFAFTGNKFEFRAVGSSASISTPLTYLNTAVSSSIRAMNEKLKSLAGGSQPNENHVTQIILETLTENKPVLFEGNNYDEKWHSEAVGRGLKNLRTTPEALEVLTDKGIIELFTKNKVLTETELNGRFNVLVEQYNKLRLIEMETLQELVNTHVLPAADCQLIRMGEAADALDELKLSADHLKTAAKPLHEASVALRTEVSKLNEMIQSTHGNEEEVKVAHEIGSNGVPLMDRISDLAGVIEENVDDELWSLPKFRELIYMI